MIGSFDFFVSGHGFGKRQIHFIAWNDCRVGIESRFRHTRQRQKILRAFLYFVYESIDGDEYCVAIGQRKHFGIVHECVCHLSVG